MDVAIHTSWKEILHNEFTKPYFTQLKEEVKRLTSLKKDLSSQKEV